ncbi:MAG: nuclear transport factor 2 family protein [Gammaproteobacteria bacterium]|nr:nuclear transport factor 2 family protein [Gammaproteobacteria bacterium]
MGKLTFLMFIVLVSLLSACQHTGMYRPSSSKADEAKINQVIAHYRDMVNQSNVDQLAKLYRAEAIQIAPHESAVISAADIYTRARAHHERYRYELQYSEPRIRISGDIAYFRSNYRETMMERDSKEEAYTESGVWLVIFLRQDDGEWLIDSETWNDETPMQERLNLLQ